MNNESSSIGIVIPAYNCARYLGDAIRSCRTQLRENDQIVIVNDGSTEPLDSIEAEFLDDGQVLWINQENRGISAARNAAVAASSTDFVRFLDADDIMLPDSLNAARRFLSRFPDTDFLFSDYYMSNKPETRVLFSKTDPTMLENYIPVGQSAANSESWLVDTQFNEDYCSKRIDPSIVCTDTVTLRRKVFDQVGGFDLGLKVAEDHELWKRALETSRAGYIHSVPGAVYFRWRGSKEKYRENYETEKAKHLAGLKQSAFSKEYWRSRKQLSDNALRYIYWISPLKMSSRQIFKYAAESFGYLPFRMRQARYVILALLPKSFIRKLMK